MGNYHALIQFIPNDLYKLIKNPFLFEIVDVPFQLFMRGHIYANLVIFLVHLYEGSNRFTTDASK